ncbi:hypothetical protein ACFL04_04620 [Patescibacteria group bacterium]
MLKLDVLDRTLNKNTSSKFSSAIGIGPQFTERVRDMKKLLVIALLISSVFLNTGCYQEIMGEVGAYGETRDVALINYYFNDVTVNFIPFNGVGVSADVPSTFGGQVTIVVIPVPAYTTFKEVWAVSTVNGKLRRNYKAPDDPVPMIEVQVGGRTILVHDVINIKL